MLNFISEGPAPQGKISGDYQLQAHSNTLGLNNSLGIKGAPGRFFAGARFNHKTHSDFKQGGGDYVPNSWFNERSVSVNTGCNTNIGTFKLSYYYYMQELGMIYPFVLPLIKERNRRNDIWYQDPHHHLVALQNKLYMGKLRFDINAAWQGNVRRAYAKTPTPFVERRLNTLTYETKIHLPSNEKSDYILGIQGMEQTNRNINNRAKKRIPDADISRFGALFFTQHTFSKLKLQGGLRIDFSSVDSFGSGEEGTEKYRAPVSEHYFSPNGSLGATYRLSDETTLRINFAKACRMPNLRESLVTGLVGSRYEIAGKDLKPEEAYEGDFSFHYNGKSLSLDAAVFYNHIDNYIYLAPSGENTPKGVAIFKTSQNNAKLHGGEAALHYHPLFAHWIHFKTTFSSVIGKQENGEYLPFIPAHKLRYEIGIENESLWIFKQPSLYVSALTAFKQGDPARFETETDGYTIFNVRTNARIKINNQDMLLGLSVNNIMDKKYIDHLSSLKVMNFCNMGRNISISLKVPFGLK